jgi:hypothetical protein
MNAKKEVSYSKEVDDVLVLVIELVKDIKAKKGAAEIATENLANLMAALSGIDSASEELKDKVVALQTIGYRTGELSAALLA